jgi:hypothetical protein
MPKTVSTSAPTGRGIKSKSTRKENIPGVITSSIKELGGGLWKPHVLYSPFLPCGWAWRSLRQRSTRGCAARHCNEDGYIVLKSWLISLPNIDDIRTKPIFNDNSNAHSDKKRKQATLRTAWSRQIRGRLASGWPALIPSAGVLLESESGCQRQAAHCDYVPSAELTSAEPKPLLVLIAIEPNTTIEIWPGSHISGKSCVRTTVVLDAGDAIVFRADLVHAGSAYEVRNRRLHFYLDSPAVRREPNRTWIIYKHAPAIVQALIDES